MKQIKPQLPSGMRDYLPADMIRRQYVIDTLVHVFETYGYEPLQTPVLELSETLNGKYGPDAEKLIYYASHPGGDSDKLALRYDLTVPLARVFALHEATLPLPFRRYQIAPVWRAERPQRGRYRELYQCDFDVVGVSAMSADSETVSIIVAALRALSFSDAIVKINNRKLLIGIGQYAGLSGEPLANLYRSIDKLGKIGITGIREEMLHGGIDADVVTRIMDLLVQGRTESDLSFEAAEARLRVLRRILQDIPIAVEGLAELDTLFDYLAALGVPGHTVEFDSAMVRGLSYYTGPIFEAVLNSADPEERVGSVAGGGRYDDLIGLFRKQSLPTVGAALGFDRLMYLMDKRQSYPSELRQTVVEVLVTVFSPDTRPASMNLVSTLRAAGIKTELVLEDTKLGKQFGYASRKGIALVALIGPDEIAADKVKLKRLADQTEVTVNRENIISEIQRLLTPVLSRMP